ncbi:MAG: permease-like cell division protein FtsX [Clostridiales bacterium]|jgi:cell division transport system permease protein|nr:permease-like cell division protein FtsX [Eubacteriales bacterium]MDH7566982.1 permease-like cell division protein FtsX [Clostridiales bacterium]
MKVRTVRYIIKEGLKNAYRNKLMSFASIAIVTASLIMFGAFYLFTVIVNYNTQAFKDKLEMEVFLKPELDDAQVDRIEESIKANGKIGEYKKVTKEEAYEKAKQLLGDDGKVLEGIDASFLPVSFKIKLKDPQDSKEVVEQFKNMSGVENVAYSQKTVELFSKVSYWVRVISTVLISVLLIVSMFIISNTIKLTVFARRKEIGIMKYIGATDGFIRWPFVVEGVIIGIIGAVLAFVVTGNAYHALEVRFNADVLNMGADLFTFVKFRDIGLQLIGIYCLAGIFIGAVGSLISIRKYLRV